MAGEFTKFLTCSQAMTQAMGELGLSIPSAFNGSTDPTITQLLKFLTAAGQDLCLMTDWQMLHKEWTLVLTPGTSFPLPADWNSFVDSTMWDNTARWPVIGPITPQIWRMLKARLLGAEAITLQYRIVANQFVLYFNGNVGDTLQADYYSRGWVIDGVQTPLGTVYRDNVANDSDQLLFDGRILVPLLKYKWRTAKGFDTTSDKDDFETGWDLVVGRDTPAPTLSIGASSGYPYLSYGNMPDTNYGL